MKKYIKFFAISLLVIAAVMYASCNKEEMQSEKPAVKVPNEGKYKKEILISDRSGNNKVQLEISTDDKSLLEFYNQEGPFAIAPVFEDKIEDEDQTVEPAVGNPFEIDRTPVIVKVLAMTLEKDAIGFKLEVNYTDHSRVSWSGDHWFLDGSSSGNSWVCAAHQGPDCSTYECHLNGYRIKITPSNPNCVSAWFYQYINGNWYWDCPGPNGYYLCTVSRTSVSSGPIFLHALGNRYNVYYYTQAF